jgi:hypothetical protein
MVSLPEEAGWHSVLDTNAPDVYSFSFCCYHKRGVWKRLYPYCGWMDWFENVFSIAD